MIGTTDSYTHGPGESLRYKRKSTWLHNSDGDWRKEALSPKITDPTKVNFDRIQSK
jgi:hypothetical protein